MGHSGDFSCCSFNKSNGSSPDVNLFFTQTEGSQSIPFGAGTETTVLTLPVVTTQNLQPVKLDGFVQMQGSALGLLALLSYLLAVRLRVRRNGVLLITQMMRQESAISLGLGLTTITSIPISLVDNNSVLGTNTYTVTLEFFDRIPNNANSTITAQTRSLNALTV